MTRKPTWTLITSRESIFPSDRLQKKKKSYANGWKEKNIERQRRVTLVPSGLDLIWPHSTFTLFAGSASIQFRNGIRSAHNVTSVLQNQVMGGYGLSSRQIWHLSISAIHSKRCIYLLKYRKLKVTRLKAHRKTRKRRMSLWFWMGNSREGKKEIHQSEKNL